MLAIIVFLFICVFIAGLLIIRVHQKTTNVVCASNKRLDGKTVVVTGGTAGMGLEIAIDLARRGGRIIVACPFEDEGAHALKQIVQQSGNEDVVYTYLDLASLESIRTFASDIVKNENRLDVLINNAGVGNIGNVITEDGMHFVMQVNYFGTFLLTLLLLPLLKKTGQPLEPSRIVNTSSVLHWSGNVDFSNLHRTNTWLIIRVYLIKVYANSKLCLVLFTHELSKRLRGSHVVVNCVDPGAVGTRIIASGSKFIGGMLKLIFFYMFKTPWEGAQTALHVALDKEAGEVSGKYFKNCEISKASALGYDDKTAQKLWEESVRLVKLSDNELNMCLES